MLAGEPLDVSRDATEYAPQVIHSMVTGTLRRIHGNVANRGLISNLPEGYAVEVPCVVDALGVRPERVGALPPQCAALNRGFVNVGAADRAGGGRPATSGWSGRPRWSTRTPPRPCRVDQIWALCDELTAAHGDLMPESLCDTQARSRNVRLVRQTL